MFYIIVLVFCNFVIFRQVFPRIHLSTRFVYVYYTENSFEFKYAFNKAVRYRIEFEKKTSFA